MAYMDYLDTVQQVYIAYYQRPADSEGLLYWAQRLDTDGGNLTAIIDAFATSTESNSLYGAIGSTTITSVVASMYQALFGRAPDVEGLNFYVTGFNAGTFTAGTIAMNILDGAQNDDAQVIANKLSQACSFTEVIDPDLNGDELQATYAGNTDAEAGRDFLSTVTSSSTSLRTSEGVMDYIMNYIADSDDPVFWDYTEFCYTLSTDVDHFVGGIGNDFFNGPLDVGGVQTFGSADIIDGRAGTDMLYLEVGGGTYTTSNVDNIEIFQVVASGAATFDMNGSSGCTELGSFSSADVIFNNISSPRVDGRVWFSNTEANHTFNFLNSSLSETTDRFDLILEGNMGGTITISDTAGPNALETIAVTVEYSEAVLTGITVTDLGAATLLVSGYQNLDLGTLTDATAGGATLDTIDASGFAADLTVTAVAGTPSTIITANGATTTTSITLSADNGTDIIILNPTATGVVSITNFLAGSNGDDAEMDLSGVEHGEYVPGADDLVSVGSFATSLAGGDPLTFIRIAGATDLGTVTGNVLVLDGDLADAALAAEAMETGGSHALTANGAFNAATDLFLVTWDDGSNSYIGVGESANGALDNGTFAAGDLTVNPLVTLVGVSDATTLVAENLGTTLNA
ncbi:MAG: DUF4214 domain-containing protein [Pseudomonadota bacterium]